MIDAEAYGRALFELAAEDGRDAPIGDDLEIVRSLLAEQPSYAALMDTPAVPAAEKLELLHSAFAEADPLVLNFLSILCEKRSMHCFADCAAAYRKSYDEAHGLLRATAVTAVPLREDQAAALKNKLAAISGKTVVLENRVDPAIISGVVLRCGNIQLDDSMKNRLDTLRRSLRETIV